MRGFFTGVVGALVEAWQEVRLNRGRVLLSLFGVMIAVCALSGSVAFTQMSGAASVEQNERYSGRPATLGVWMEAPMTESATIQAEQREAQAEAWAATTARYSIDYVSRNLSFATQVRTMEGDVDAQVTAVDPPYGTMHRTLVDDGSWFAPDDADRLAPAVLINNDLWEMLGSPDLASHPTVILPGLERTTAVVIGRYATQSWGEPYAEMMILTDALAPFMDTLVSEQGVSPNFEAWVPTESSEEISDRLVSDLTLALGEGWTVNSERTDAAVWMEDQPDIFGIITLAIGGVVLLLGSLSLINIALVTVRQRVREIGVRRSVGATRSRIFTAVMLESVVATFLAGVVGVMLAVLIMRIPMVSEAATLGIPLETTPHFPVEAAVLGLVSATVVGTLAGLIPALVAVRVRVIEALRY